MSSALLVLMKRLSSSSLLFGHHTEECEMVLWCRLGHAMDLPWMQRLLAMNQEELQQEYANFVTELSDYANKEIRDFRYSIMSLGDSL